MRRCAWLESDGREVIALPLPLQHLALVRHLTAIPVALLDCWAT